MKSCYYFLPLAATLAAQQPLPPQQGEEFVTTNNNYDNNIDNNSYNNNRNNNNCGIDDFWEFDTDSGSATAPKAAFDNGQQQWTFTTYNTQGFGTRTVHEVLTRINSDIICLQAIGARWGGFTQRQEGQGCYFKNVGQYWVIIWLYVPSNPWANRTWGVAIAVKRRTLPKSALAAVWTPDESIQGRAGCIRLRMRKGPDFCIGVGYLPPVGAMAHQQQSFQIWKWFESTLAIQPLMTLPIFGLDANARIGNRELIPPDRLLQVGSFGRNVENQAGRLMRGFLQQTSLAAINSLYESSAGNTWYNTRGHASRIDFILSTPLAAQETVEIQVDRKLGFLLQNASAAQLADHCPVTWKFTHPCPLPGHRPSQRWSRDLVNYVCSRPTLLNGLYQTIDEWASNSITTEAAEQAVQTGDVDVLWSLANEGARVAAEKYAPFQLATQFPAESFEVSHLLSQRWEHKQTLHSLLSEATLDHAAIRRQERELRNLRARTAEARNRWWSERQTNLAAEIIQAAGKHCWRQLWSGVRRISQSLLGPLGRVYHQLPNYDPTLDDWLQAMQLPGPQGGCHSKTIWQGEADELTSFLRMGQLALGPTDNAVLQQTAQDYVVPTDAEATTQGLQDFEDLKVQLQRRTNGFAVPFWSLPKDLWRALLSGPWCNPGADTQLPMHFHELFRQLCVLIRKTGQMPLQWLLSYGCGIPKYNGKPGVLSYRLLHLLDPVSKAWNAALWRRKNFRLGHTAFGFIAGRRREEANMLVRIMIHRLSKAGFLVIAALFDIANAFPSLSWRYLEQHSYKHIPSSDLHFLIRRHRHSLTLLIDAAQQAGAFRAMTGTRQGDTSAAQEFAKAYDSAIRNWRRHRYTVLDRHCFVARDPWTKTPVCLNAVLF
ncbi:unnamed protein product, partial [Polarella glacialis]